MTIFFNNIKRIFRKKVNLLVMFVVPIAFIIIISMLSNSSSSSLTIGIVDNDNTKLTTILETSLKGQGTIKFIKQDKINDELINQNIDTAIVIPKGFTKEVLDGKNVDMLQMYGIKEASNNDSSINYYVNSFVEAARNISVAAKGDSTKFYQGIKDYQKGNFSAAVKLSNGKKQSVDNATSSLGYLIMGILYLSTMATTMIIKDKEQGVYDRIFSSGINSRSYMFQSILSFVAINLIQTGIILIIMKNFIGTDLGPSVLNVFVVLAVFGVVSVALGVAICSWAKDLRQANALVALVSTPLLMLGGCFWPKEIMGSTLQKISNFVPTNWALDGVNKVLNGSSLMDISKDLGIMLLFIVLFFAISAVKKIQKA